MFSSAVASLLLASSINAEPRLAPVLRDSLGRVTGIAHDSVAARPLGNALLQWMSEDRATLLSVRTDSAGRYELDKVRAGQWFVSIVHPRVDSLGIVELVRGVHVKPDTTTDATIALPSARTLITQACGAAAAADSVGYARGYVRQVIPDADPALGSVRFAWQELTIASEGTRQRIATAEAVVGKDGAFLACGVPQGISVQVRASRGADSTGLLELEVPDHGIVWQELAVGPVRPLVVRLDRGSAADTMTVWRGDGALRGAVQIQSGAPVANARVSMAGTGLEMRTGTDGTFDLRTLPLGSHMLELRAIGLEPWRRIVDVLADSMPPMTLAMDRLLMLDTVRVRALRDGANVDIRGFEQRRSLGIGTFFGPEDVARMQPKRITDLFWNVPWLRVVSGPNGEYVQMRNYYHISGRPDDPMRTFCNATIFIDRVRVNNRVMAPTETGAETAEELPPGFLDGLRTADQIRAVEIYERPSQAPSEFQHAYCGSIVIWTGKRPAP